MSYVETKRGEGGVINTATPKRRRRGNLFVIGRQPSKAGYLTIAIAVFVVIAASWWILTGMAIVPPIFLPAPHAVIAKMVQLANDGTLWTDLKISLYRISIAFLISSVMSIFFGVLAGSYGFWKASIEPFVDFVRYMPVVAFVPLTILWAGTGDFQK
ncbi:ABC transporter permease, partial [Pseudomonas sp.]|uniref:ABC transporter permease n=1 Tax=Pseudomonas sp. TaxID=306 RepID=UPI00345D0A09